MLLESINLTESQTEKLTFIRDQYNKINQDDQIDNQTAAEMLLDWAIRHTKASSL